MIFFYKTSLLNTPLDPLVYHSDSPLEPGRVVKVPLQNRVVVGVILNALSKPSFDTEQIESAEAAYYNENQRAFAEFISAYYFCSYGEALGLFLPYSNAAISHTHWAILKPVALSYRQNSAFAFLKQYKVALLFGDTG